MTEKEKPCDEAVLTEMFDKNGEKCKLVLGKNIDVKEVNYVD